MSNKKQLVLYKLFIKKVYRLIKINKEPIDTILILNKQNNTLDNLYNNLNFKEVYYSTPF